MTKEQSHLTPEEFISFSYMTATNHLLSYERQMNVLIRD